MLYSGASCRYCRKTENTSASEGSATTTSKSIGRFTPTTTTMPYGPSRQPSRAEFGTCLASFVGLIVLLALWSIVEYLFR